MSRKADECKPLDDGSIAISADLEVGYFEQQAVSGSVSSVYQEARSRMTRINAAAEKLRLAESECESEDVAEACQGADKFMNGKAWQILPPPPHRQTSPPPSSTRVLEPSFLVVDGTRTL